MTDSPLIDFAKISNVDKCIKDIVECIDIDDESETYVEYFKNCNKLIEIDDYDNKDLVYKFSKK